MESEYTTKLKEWQRLCGRCSGRGCGCLEVLASVGCWIEGQ